MVGKSKGGANIYIYGLAVSDATMVEYRKRICG